MYRDAPTCSGQHEQRNGGTIERGQAGAEDARTGEESRRCKEDTRNCSRKRQEKPIESRSCTMMSRSCSAYGKDGTGMTTKAGGSIQSCAPRREEVEYIRRHKMHTRVPREVCLRETDKEQPG